MWTSAIQRRLKLCFPWFGLEVISRLLEEPSLATTLQGVYFYWFRRYMFRPSLGNFRRNAQLFSESYLTTTDPLFWCYRSYFVYGLANTAVAQKIWMLKSYIVLNVVFHKGLFHIVLARGWGMSCVACWIPCTIDRLDFEVFHVDKGGTIFRYVRSICF
jgi:hypothetical protein